MQTVIGNTPLIRLEKIEREFCLKGRLYAKLESYNPTGSIKDRTAKGLLDDAERRGVLKRGGTVIEPTSGNTGIALAMLCKLRGYKAVIVMPETMSEERRKLMLDHGAELVLTDGAKGMQGAIERANELLKTTENAFIPDQFSNPAGAQIHYETTGKELLKDLNGEISAFVAGVGTGGTFTGVTKRLKESIPSVKGIAVEPKTSAVLSGEQSGAHGIQGIGAGFIPKVLDRSLIDEVLKISDGESVETAKLVFALEGISAGISSGANLFGAIQIAKRAEYAGKNIVTVFPDDASKYRSTGLF